MKVWLNGKFTDSRDAKISVFDRGFLYGDGLFETMRAYAGSIFLPDEHLARLFNSSKNLGIKIPYSKKELREASHSSIRRNRLKDAYIRITVTRGGNAIILTKEFEERPRRDYIDGASAKVSSMRSNEHSPLAGMKTLNFMNYLIAKEEAKAGGYGEAILLNTKGDVAEGATSNIFLVKNGRLLTPSLDSGILPGITRRAIIGIASRLKIAVVEKHVLYKELSTANEVFVTNSLIEVLPVVKIDSGLIGNGRPGNVTKLLHVLYRRMI